MTLVYLDISRVIIVNRLTQDVQAKIAFNSNSNQFGVQKPRIRRYFALMKFHIMTKPWDTVVDLNVALGIASVDFLEMT